MLLSSWAGANLAANWLRVQLSGGPTAFLHWIQGAASKKRLIFYVNVPGWKKKGETSFAFIKNWLLLWQQTTRIDWFRAEWPWTHTGAGRKKRRKKFNGVCPMDRRSSSNKFWLQSRVCYLLKSQAVLHPADLQRGGSLLCRQTMISA